MSWDKARRNQGHHQGSHSFVSWATQPIFNSCVFEPLDDAGLSFPLALHCPSWWICGQGAGDSDIANQSNPPLWWHWSRWAHSLPYLYLNPDDSLRPDLRPWIHFGDHLGGSSCVSKDLDQHLRSNLSLADWLKNNAESALCHNKLPGICHPKISLENLTCQWGSGVMKAKETDLRKIIDYPFNGLFRHPVNRERERPREEFVLKCESFVTKPSGF